MKTVTTERFDNAVRKLYTAFHEGTLDAMDYKHCAVGNMCGNTDEWAGTAPHFGHPNRTKLFTNNNTGYSNAELATIESIFITGLHENNGRHTRIFYNNHTPEDVEHGYITQEELKQEQFKGLCAVVEYLCELDNIPNVMDYTKLFERKNDKPKYELV